MLSKWARLLPWHYAKRRQPTRAVEEESAIADDLVAIGAPGLSYDDVVDAYRSLPEWRPVGPVKLTREQWEWIRPSLMCSCGVGHLRPSLDPLWATPVVIVASWAESTPHVEGWAGWAGWNTAAGYRPSYAVPPLLRSATACRWTATPARRVEAMPDPIPDDPEWGVDCGVGCSNVNCIPCRPDRTPCQEWMGLGNDPWCPRCGWALRYHPEVTVDA
jgi:hypothetical protein